MKKSSAKLHIFDLDHTLLNGNGSFSFGVYLFFRGIIPFKKMVRLLWYYVNHHWKRITTTEIHERVFSELFEGQSKLKFTALVHAFIKSKGSALFYAPAISRLQEAQKRGEPVAICSSSPDFLVECFAHHLKVPFWRGSKYHVNKAGVFAHITTLIGEEKVNYLHTLQQNCKTDQTVAYSDSIRDLHFLEAAKCSIGVQPDRELRQICKRLKWEII